MSKTFYVTTPLYSVNAEPHMAQAYTIVLGDALARYKRLVGREVCALAGIDGYGVNVERAARKCSLTPRQLADREGVGLQETWSRLSLQFDRVIRTTDEHHAEAVQELFRRMKTNKYVYPGEYKGSCCVNCEACVDGPQAICPNCGSPTESISEQTYFFRLSALRERLLAFYQDNSDFVVPSPRMNEVVSLVTGGLQDIPITRTSISWGIRVEDDEEHIFDSRFGALTGYLSGAGFPHDMARFRKLWPTDVQLVGNDTLQVQAVNWPAFLMAAGFELPHRIIAHGWSTGASTMTREVTDLLPADHVRYFLLRETPLGGDAEFSYPALISRANTDLVNGLGNLSARILKMLENYFDGAVPEPGDSEGGDEELRRFSKETVQLYRESFDHQNLGKSLDSVWELISVANRYVVANEPWVLARDRSKKMRLGTVLYNAAETLRIIAALLSPFVPDGSGAILRQLGAEDPGESQKPNGLNWGGLKPGGRTGPLEAVYTRLEPEEVNARLLARRGQEQPDPASGAPVEPTQPGKPGEISIEDFAKVEMRVGKILEAERVPNSDKLVKLQVDIGDEKRQLVAGIGKAYPPETLIGRVVVVVANLKPAKLMGVVSNGMIVAASHGGVPVLATFTEPVVLGSRLK